MVQFEKTSYKFVIPNPVNEQAFSGPQSRAGFAREWAELASRGEGPCVSEVVKLYHHRNQPWLAPEVNPVPENRFFFGFLMNSAQPNCSSLS